MSNIYAASQGLNQLEQLALQNSPLHRLHPLAKMLSTLAYIVVVVSFSPYNISGLMPFLFYPCILLPLSGTPARPLLLRLLVALPFPLMAGLGNLFMLRQTALWLGGFAVSYGMLSLLSILLKTLLCVLAILLLMATTPLSAISGQLYALRLPQILCLQFILTYRYLALLLDEGAGMFTAYSLRAPKAKGLQMRHMGSFMGQLLLRSFSRAERVYQAMKCRGFSGVYRGGNVQSLRLADFLYATLLIAGLVTLRFFNLSALLGAWAG